jgi:hypothetical protein
MRHVILPIQDQVARFDSQRGATCKVDANKPLAFRMHRARINTGEFDLIKAE